MAASSPVALRWRLLKRSLLRSKSDEIDEEAARVSRVPSGSFGLIASRCVEDNEEIDGILWEYTLPDERTTALLMRQSRSGQFKLSDHSSCRELGIDNTGVICLWPAEEILAYYCVSRPEMFRNKRIIELGAGYGLAGLALAACTDAAEVLITDGNPKVVNYIQKNCRLNAELFGKTKVSSEVLYWCKEPVPLDSEFDFIIAADCTYFKDFHLDLVHTIKSILTRTMTSEALLFCPRRGESLFKFIEIAKSAGLAVAVKEVYDADIYKLHKEFLQAENTQWLNYDADHNYPLLISLTGMANVLTG